VLKPKSLARITEGGNQEWAVQRNWQHWVHKTQDENKQNKKHITICVGHHHTQETRRRKKPSLFCQTFWFKHLAVFDRNDIVFLVPDSC
jgi:hypothetical protein